MSARTTWTRVLGLGLGAIWAAWWTFFAVASSLGEVFSRGHAFSHVPVAIVLALLSAIAVAWRWPAAGRILFAAFGLLLLWASVYFFNNPPATIWFLVLTLALPPLVSGLLLLADQWYRRPPGNA